MANLKKILFFGFSGFFVMAHALASSPAPVQINSSCTSKKESQVAQRDVSVMGMIVEDSAGKSRVLTIPIRDENSKCLQATTTDGKLLQLKMVRQSYEAGLAELEVVKTEATTRPTKKINTLSLARLDVYSESSFDHMIPWLDRAWEVSERNHLTLASGMPVVGDQNEWIGLISSQKLGGLNGKISDGETQILIPKDYIQRWMDLNHQNALPAQDQLNSHWFDQPTELPLDLAPGLIPDSFYQSGVDPMGINGRKKLDAAGTSSSAEALRIISDIKNDKLLGLITKRNDVWFELPIKSASELSHSLSEYSPVLSLKMGARSKNRSLTDVEKKARQLSKNFQVLHLSDALILPDQVRILARLARSQASANTVQSEINHLKNSQTLAPLWQLLELRSPSQVVELKQLLQEIENQVRDQKNLRNEQ